MITNDFLCLSLKRGMKKTAQMSGSAKSSLMGAGLGAGLGGLAWLLRPKDRDQKQWKEALISILGGAALGGIGGWGFHHLTNNTPVDAVKYVGRKSKDVANNIFNHKDEDKKVDEKPDSTKQQKSTNKEQAEPIGEDDDDTMYANRSKYIESAGPVWNAGGAIVGDKPFYVKSKFVDGKEYVIHYPTREGISSSDIPTSRVGDKNRVFSYPDLLASLNEGDTKEMLIAAAKLAKGGWFRDSLVEQPLYVEFGANGDILLSGKKNDGTSGAATFTPRDLRTRQILEKARKLF